jgi:hypothetical protein
VDRRKISTCVSLFLFLLTVFYFAAPRDLFASQLALEITTDKTEYDPGEVVTVTVRIFLDGQPVSGHIDRAYIDVTDAAGFPHRSYISKDFTQVSPGVFVAYGKAGRPGSRQVYVAASTTVKEGCCCERICGVGFAFYSVRQVCQPCYQPCYQPCCQPCWQPCYPCAECRAPDFFLKYFVDRPDIGGEEKLILSIKDHVMQQLLQMANPITFREAPPHSVMWSDFPGMGWTNDALADLGLSLDPETGMISGYLGSAALTKDKYFFFIEALNPGGEVIAGIWIEIYLI